MVILFATIERPGRFSVVINPQKRRNLATIWKVMTCFQGAIKLAVVGWLVGFSKSQLKKSPSRFKTPLEGCRIAKKADFLSVLPVLFLRLRSANS